MSTLSWQGQAILAPHGRDVNINICHRRAARHLSDLTALFGKLQQSISWQSGN